MLNITLKILCFILLNQKEESETMEPGGPRLLAIVILLVGVITWTQETLRTLRLHSTDLEPAAPCRR